MTMCTRDPAQLCYRLRLRITKAAITPGTHPANVKIKTIKTDPQP